MLLTWCFFEGLPLSLCLTCFPNQPGLVQLHQNNVTWAQLPAILLCVVSMSNVGDADKTFTDDKLPLCKVAEASTCFLSYIGKYNLDQDVHSKDKIINWNINCEITGLLSDMPQEKRGINRVEAQIIHDFSEWTSGLQLILLQHLWLRTIIWIYIEIR